MPDTDKIFGQIINCPICRHNFVVCHSCYRGQKYCSRECLQKSFKLRCLLANNRYQATENGKRKHRLRQNTYRRHKKKVTHRTSPSKEKLVETQNEQGLALKLHMRSIAHCLICGRRIAFFSNEPSSHPMTQLRRNKRRKRRDKHRKCGRDPPAILR